MQTPTPNAIPSRNSSAGGAWAEPLLTRTITNDDPWNVCYYYY